MSATNKTPYLDLPQFIGTDVPSWLGDFNGAMLKIDTGYNNALVEAQNAVSTATNAENVAQAAKTATDQNTAEIGVIKTQISGLGNWVDETIVNAADGTWTPLNVNLQTNTSLQLCNCIINMNSVATAGEPFNGNPILMASSTKLLKSTTLESGGNLVLLYKTEVTGIPKQFSYEIALRVTNATTQTDFYIYPPGANNIQTLTNIRGIRMSKIWTDTGLVPIAPPA